MTSTSNINFVEQAVSKFQTLDRDDRLIVLALIYHGIAYEIPAITSACVPKDKDQQLLSQIQQLSTTEQIFALRQLLSQEEQEEKIISTENYISMNIECKMSFWYHLAQNLGTTIVGIPEDYIPSEKAIEVLELVDTTNVQEIVIFLERVL
ncbi:orange carotenoid protein N-terminal domain-containing protein [Anabaena sp. CCY 0017]|uniref:orange carotenoid protein N-terminal domain-containing protein n=1 Tax=Anabaena sp. CCY 0017 TaxID=3103866 RepID=UPI0039C71D08